MDADNCNMIGELNESIDESCPVSSPFISSSPTSSSSSTSFISLDMGQYSFPIFDQLRRDGKLCDIRIRVDKKVMNAHKVVLCATIPYFHAMFSHDMIESKKEEIIIKEGIDSTAFELLLNYAYTGNLTITPNNVQSLLLGSSFLQLECVREACCDYLTGKLNANNVLGVVAFADSLGCVSLVAAAKDFIQKQFTQVAKSKEFLSLSSEELEDIVSKSELVVLSELNVFEAVMDWVKHDIDGRRNMLPQILTHVRLPLLRPHELIDFVAKEELIRSNHRCRDLVDEAKDYHLMPERRHLISSFRTTSRLRPDLVGFIYAVGGLNKNDRSLSTVEVFNPATGTWKMAQAMTMLRSRVGVAVLHNKLYAIGGYNGTERLNTVEVFDPKSQTWTKVASLNCKRSAVGAATLDDRLYVCGGYDGITSLNTVEVYNPDEDNWILTEPMSKHRSAAGVVALDGLVYALGGHDGLSIFESTEVFDPREKTWKMTTPMSNKRCRLGVAAFRDKIYVCGGYDGSMFLQTAEVYDPKTQKWSPIAPMNVMRSRVALVANKSKLYAIGGYDGVSNLKSVEVYDPETDSWSFAADMCAHEGGVGVGVIPIP